LDKSVTVKKRSLDIFRVLDNTSKKNASFYADLTEEEQKGYLPVVVMRWLTGTKEARQIYFINELVNPFVFDFTKHKQLLYSLMTCCANGKPQRYYWNKALSKKSTKSPVTIGVIREFFNYNTIHAIDALPLLSDDIILEYAAQLGRPNEDIAKIKKELKTR
jgi:hypothetical protein